MSIIYSHRQLSISHDLPKVKNKSPIRERHLDRMTFVMDGFRNVSIFTVPASVLGGELEATGSSGGQPSASGILSIRSSLVSGVLFFLCRSYFGGFGVVFTGRRCSCRRGKHFLTDRLYCGLIAACAVFLVVFAGYFAYTGIAKLNAMISLIAVFQSV